MDKIIIKDLEIFAYHGVFDSEKREGQKFYISIELLVDLRPAGVSDDLTKTIHYGELCQDIKREFTKVSYDLIERAAEELASYILSTRPLAQAVKILIKKPSAPIGLPLDYVAVEIERSVHEAYIALGSNIGNKEKNLDKAIEMVGKFATIERKSTYIVTKPVGYIDQPDFLNGVIKVKTTLSPQELLQNLQNIEKELHRVKTVKDGPRTIDLDILLFDNEIITTDELVVPHPRMHERAFVLVPLNEIAPYAVHSLLNKRVVDLLASLTVREQL